MSQLVGLGCLFRSRFSGRLKEADGTTAPSTGPYKEHAVAHGGNFDVGRYILARLNTVQVHQRHHLASGLTVRSVAQPDAMADNFLDEYAMLEVAVDGKPLPPPPEANGAEKPRDASRSKDKAREGEEGDKSRSSKDRRHRR